MRELGQLVKIVAVFAALSCALLMALLPLATTESLAQPPPPPSITAVTPVTNTPTSTSEVPPTATDTGTPTPTPEVPPTATDTSTPTSTPTATSAAPTFTHTPTNTPTQTRTPTRTPTFTPQATRPLPTSTPTDKPPRTPRPRPQPNCQSSVEGYVLNAAGQRAAGATVRITATGYSNQMLVDDGGHYGFGGLCAGVYTLQATLTNGQWTAAATASLDGQNSVRVDLRVAAAVTTVPGTQATTAVGPTSEPNMPTTGYSGWLLVGGAVLGTVLLFTAGARRIFGSHRN